MTTMTKIYVTVDIGCIECGEDTEILGVFSNREDCPATRNYFTVGEHSIETFEVYLPNNLMKEIYNSKKEEEA